MIRLAAVLLVLSLASPALALPVSYDFVATGDGGGDGTLTYDADTDAVELSSFIAFRLPPIDWVGGATWPASRDAFPVVSLSFALSHQPGSLDGLTLDGVVTVVLDVGGIYPYMNGCAPGTPLPDCPLESFGGYYDQGPVRYALEIVPEPSAIATLLAAATALLIRKRYGQLPSVPSSQASGQLEHFGPDGGA